MVVVADNSALSALAELGQLPLLSSLFGEVSVTESVRREGMQSGAPEALRDWLANPPPWLHLAEDPAEILEETAGLGMGEASAITLAWEHRSASLLVLDERRGRRVAAALGLRKTGVLAILAESSNRGLADFEDALEKLMKNRTSLVIAHRLSTIQKADTILVLKEGKLLESGNHESLSQKEGGLYRELKALQN